MALTTIPTTCLTVFTMMFMDPAPTSSVANQGEEEGSARSRAVELRGEGEASFYQGDYDAAIEHFERAHALDGDPTDLFNIGRIHEQQGNLVQALARYEEFAALPELSLEERSAAAERIKVLRVLVASEEPTAAAGRSGPYSGSASDPMSDANGSRTDAATGKRLVITGATLLGVGAAAALAGGVAFGLAARRRADQVSELAEGSNPTRLTLAEAESLDAEGKDYSTLQITFIVAGSALALAGAGVLAGGLVRNKQRARLSAVSPVVSPDGVALATQWRF